MTADFVIDLLARTWRAPEVFVVPYRLAGNRYAYAATDHDGHYAHLNLQPDGRTYHFTPGFCPLCGEPSHGILCEGCAITRGESNVPEAET